ncbi:MAG: hypothetical protein U1F66_03750 [bacterium]
MKPFLPIGIILFAISACSGPKKQWPQEQRSELVQACVENTKKNPALDQAKVQDYCTCYQQKLENKYPEFMDLAKLGEAAMTQVAEECLPVLTK